MNTSTQVLIIGGGFAGVSAAQELEKKGVSTILVDKKNYFEVTFATLRNIAAPETVKNSARKTYRSFLQGAFIQASVRKLSANSALLDNGDEITFEKVIIASGTRYPTLSAAKPSDSLNIVDRNQEMVDYHQQLRSSSQVLIIGGGVVGVELAGEIAYAMPEITVTLTHNKASLLDGYKEKAQQKALKQLESLGVNVIFNSRFEEKDGHYIDNKTGRSLSPDMVLTATGVLPNNEFLLDSLAHTLNPHGFINVDEKLAVIGQDNFFALGDIADVGEAKLGYLAQQQGTYLAKSIIKQLANKSSKAYKRNPLMALIPTGQKTGVVQLPFMVTTWKGLVNMKQKDLFIKKMYSAFGTEPDLS